MQLKQLARVLSLLLWKATRTFNSLTANEALILLLYIMEVLKGIRKACLKGWTDFRSLLDDFISYAS